MPSSKQSFVFGMARDCGSQGGVVVVGERIVLSFIAAAATTPEAKVNPATDKIASAKP
jgi:hypothetical protein